MSYKTTLLKETKNIIEDIKNEILELINRNEQILNIQNLNECDLKLIENNLKEIEKKEELMKVYKNNLEEVLKMKNN